MNNPKWSLEEDEELRLLVSKHISTNIREAFREYHRLHSNRSIQAASRRWYNTLRKNNKVTVCDAATSRKIPWWRRIWNNLLKVE